MASIANLPSGAQATIAAGLDAKDCTLLSTALASSAVEDTPFPPALLPFLKAAKFPASYQPSPVLWSSFTELHSLELEGAVNLDGHSFSGLKQLQRLKVRSGLRACFYLVLFRSLPDWRPSIPHVRPEHKMRIIKPARIAMDGFKAEST